jgi:hypothetical protein
VTLAMFPTGHSVFDGDDNLSRFSEAVRRFVAGSLTIVSRDRSFQTEKRSV